MKKYLLFIISVFFISISLPNQVFAQACDSGQIGGPNQCPDGMSCGPFDRCVVVDSSNLNCSGSGCGGQGSSCAVGYRCSGGKCQSDSSCSAASCTGSGCNRPGCASGYTCDNGKCRTDASCIVLQHEEEPGTCSGNGCNAAACGAGYACLNGKCIIDTTCHGDVINVPYSGPKIDSIGTLIARIYNVMFPAALIIGVLMMIKGGYEIMTSEGNPQAAKAGQEDLTAAVLGTLFIVMAGLILRMIIVQILGGSVGF